VSAKDKATNTEQSVTITASSGLSEDDVQRFVKEAEGAAKEDEEKRQTAELKNTLDSLKYQVERQLREAGDKLDQADRDELQAACDAAKTALESNDRAQIESAKNDLEKKAHKLAEKVYKAAGGSPGGGAEGGPAGGGGAQPGGNMDDVIDAEFDSM
jgi:molecular chaperone DnaK